MVGILVIAFSQYIVFPGLERIVGIETIVGRQNVYYQPDGGYYFTNPGAMVRWIASVVAVGLLVVLVGSACIFKARRSANKTLHATAAAPAS